MVSGLVVLSLAGVMFFFGTFRKISKYFVNDFFALGIIFLVVLTNIVSPVTVNGFEFYIGSALLFVSLFVMIFALNKGRALFLALGGIVLCSVALGLFKFLLVDAVYVKAYIYVLAMSAVGGIAGFCLGIDPLLCFSLPYISLYVCDITACILGARSLGGGSSFASGVFGGVLSTILYMLSGYILKKQTGTSYAYEASKELYPHSNKKRKKKK